MPAGYDSMRRSMARLWEQQAPVVDAARAELEQRLEARGAAPCAPPLRRGRPRPPGRHLAPRPTPLGPLLHLYPPVSLSPPRLPPPQADPYLRTRVEGVRVEACRKALYRWGRRARVGDACRCQRCCGLAVLPFRAQ